MVTPSYGYQSEEELDIGEQKKTADILKCFKQSLTDLLSLLASFVILFTGVRAIYLITIMSQNGHLRMFNSSLLPCLGRKKPLMQIKLRQIEVLHSLDQA